jgi:hypothetical protein
LPEGSAISVKNLEVPQFFKDADKTKASIPSIKLMSYEFDRIMIGEE